MKNKPDSAGIYLPPPFVYALIFMIAWLIQKVFPLDDALFHQQYIKIVGWVLLFISSFFLVRSLRQFFQSKNPLIPHKPAVSLQTSGIYQVTRNPMYVGVAMVYLAITCFIGNWWNLILFPLLLLIVQQFIIRKEEQYLERRFGKEYEDYKSRVRRWL